jgi:hypothetical protein
MLLAAGGVAESHTAMAVEVTVTNAEYWSDHALELAQLLRGAAGGAGPAPSPNRPARLPILSKTSPSPIRRTGRIGRRSSPTPSCRRVEQPGR